MRPPLQYPGAKWSDAQWVIRQFPDHRTYTEAFGGGASVLLRKQRAHNEVYNDKDGDVVNLFRVLRDQKKKRALKQALRHTPFARDEFERAYKSSADPVERARRLLIRSHMGVGRTGTTGHSTGFRAVSNNRGSTYARSWQTLPKALDEVAERLRGVVIENHDAKEVLKAHDGDEALHYVDPPYLHDTRT
jgi:DNA adenine methylase